MGLLDDLQDTLVRSVQHTSQRDPAISDTWNKSNNPALRASPWLPQSAPFSLAGPQAVEYNSTNSYPGEENNTDRFKTAANSKRDYCIQRCIPLALPTYDDGVSFQRCVLACMTDGNSGFPIWDRHFP
jgi:hypothetical protein